MYKIMFRHPIPQKSNTHINDFKHAFRIAVYEYIKQTYNIKEPKIEKHINYIYDDVKGECIEIIWLLDDRKPTYKELTIWLNFVATNSNKRVARDDYYRKKLKKDRYYISGE